MSIFHQLADWRAEDLAGIANAETRADALAWEESLERGQRRFDEAHDVFSRALAPGCVTNSEWGAFRQLSAAELLITIAEGKPVDFRTYPIVR